MEEIYIVGAKSIKGGITGPFRRICAETGYQAEQCYNREYPALRGSAVGRMDDDIGFYLYNSTLRSREKEIIQEAHKSKVLVDNGINIKFWY